MDAYLSNSQNSLNSFDPPPVLVVADTESGKARARTTVAMAGLRIADAIGIPYTGAAGGRDAPDVREQAGINAFYRISSTSAS